MNRSSQHETIVVGVDRSVASVAALHWAATQASSRQARLHAVNVIEHGGAEDAALGRDTRLELDQARLSVPGRVAASLAQDGIDVDVAVSVVTGSVAEQLAREAWDASLVVIGVPEGSRHLTLPEELAARCLCPVQLVERYGAVTTVAEPAPPVSTTGADLDARADDKPSPT